LESAVTEPASHKYLYGLVAAILAAIIFYLYIRPLPPVLPINQVPTPPATQAAGLPWPAAGQAALGADGYGVLARHNTETPAPIGSTAKVITAVAVLKQKPILPGSQGPTITLDSSDAALFDSYYSQGGSVTQVISGEQITELQALQSMLLPSSNNMADSLAKWAFGSVDAYLTYANNMVKDLGLSNTHVGDTNGFSDTTTSTADDLVKIGLTAIKDPVIAAVVGESSAQVPVAGTINNINVLLGQDGIVGIKTGQTGEAGGCYLFAAKHTVQGHQLTLVGAVLGQASLTDAMRAAPPLLTAADSGFETLTVIHKDQLLGHYTASWGASAPFKSATNLLLLVWKGVAIKIVSRPDTIKSASAGSAVGKVTASSLQQSASSDLVLSQKLSSPSPLWRLVR
jgi:serine-type D-Ala-D-Ala carboxypeptidase (penicillin-binding protein 5/6)